MHNFVQKSTGESVSQACEHHFKTVRGKRWTPPHVSQGGLGAREAWVSGWVRGLPPIISLCRWEALAQPVLSVGKNGRR